MTGAATEVRFWDAYFRHYDVLDQAAPYRELLDRVTGLCTSSVTSAGRRLQVLDAGAGTGNLAYRLHAQGATVVALDLNRRGLLRARAKVPNLRDLDADDVAGIRFAYLEYVLPSAGGCALVQAGTGSSDGASPQPFLLLLLVLAVWRVERWQLRHL